jgi:glucose/mannose-6-phosphate isomerase
LGGSGIGGALVQDYAAPICKLPIWVTQDYDLPKFIGKNTLLIVSSYSGNTEETLSSFEQAIKAKAQIVCITSGGKVAEIAAKHKIDTVIIPGGMPPRSCLGYSFVQILGVLAANKCITNSYKADLEKAIVLIETKLKAIQKEAQKLADISFNKMPIIYAPANFESIAIRIRQQINENGKILCWHHVIPEMNHNELVGWRTKSENWMVVMLKDNDAHARINARFEANKKLIKKYTPHVFDIKCLGTSFLEKAMYWIHLGDWWSVYIADKNGVDPVEVNVITDLKNHLETIK